MSQLYQISSEKVKYPLCFVVGYVNPLHSSMNQELFEKHLCNQSSHYENTDDFCYEGKASRDTAKSTLFAASKDEWDTKEDTGKSMKNALYQELITTEGDLNSEILPYLEHYKSTGYLLVVSLHKKLVRSICNAAVLVSITIAMGDSDGRQRWNYSM